MIKFICYYLLNLNNFCKRIKNKIIFRNEYFLNKNNDFNLNKNNEINFKFLFFK